MLMFDIMLLQSVACGHRRIVFLHIVLSTLHYSIMASQSAFDSSEIRCNGFYEKIPDNFKWTVKNEISLLNCMRFLKPVGINKHLNMLLIREKISKDLKLNMTNECLWKFVNSKWNIPYADKLEKLTFISDKNRTFDLPEEFDPLIAELSKKFKNKLEKEGLNDQNNKKKLIGSSKTRPKSNSISSVDSKDSFNEVIPKYTASTSVIKSSEVRSDEVSSSRRSLRSNDKLEEFVDNSLNRKNLLHVHGSFEKNQKMKDSKQLKTKKLNQSNDTIKNKQMSNARSLKRKSGNVSESSFNSDNIKKRRSSLSTTTDLNISDGSSRSVTPETLGGKSNQSVTPEPINRKSSLRSGNKDQKNKSLVEIPSNKGGQSLSELKIEHITKLEKQDTKLTPSKNETTSKAKNKTRGRLTADYLVSQQLLELQYLGRRSIIRAKL